jgi:hypothetical protein
MMQKLEEFWKWLVKGALVWTKLYATAGLLAAVGVWRPQSAVGGLGENPWLWSALLCVLLGTLLRIEHWTPVALLFLVTVGVGTLVIGARFVITTPGLSTPQASVLIALTAATTIILGLGVYALSRSEHD